MAIPKLDLKTYYIVDMTPEGACRDAIERYMYEHGGISDMYDLLYETGGQLIYCVTDQVKIPHSQELIFEIHIKGNLEDDTEIIWDDEDDDWDEDFMLS